MMVRVMEPTSAARRRISLVVAGLAIATLAGCGDIGANDAAIIDGTTISESDVQEATAQLNTISTQVATPSTVLAELIRTPFLDGALDGTPEVLTDQQVRDLLAENGVSNPTDLTIDVARTRQYLTVLQDPEVLADPEMADAVVELQSIQASDIEAVVDEVSPRYGDFDLETGNIVPSTPEWIEPAG